MNQSQKVRSGNIDIQEGTLPMTDIERVGERDS